MDTPSTKRNNLKKALSNLRNIDGIVLFEEGRKSVTLDPTSYQLDVDEFSTHAKLPLVSQVGDKNVSVAEEAMIFYQTDFLDGFNVSLSLEFEEWALGTHTKLKMQMLALLSKLADKYTEKDLLPKAIIALRRILVIEPWQEDLHCKLFELMARNDDISGALAHYEIFRNHR